MKKLLVIAVLAGSLVACNNGTDNGAVSSDSAVLTTPSVTDTLTTTPMDSAAVAPMVDTTTAGTGQSSAAGAGQGTTGTGVTAPADSVK